MRRTTRAILLCGALGTSACTNDPQDAEKPLGSTAVVPYREAIEQLPALDETLDLDAPPLSSRTSHDLDRLGAEVARLHAKVDGDFNRLAAARAAWDAAKRELEADARELDRAIRDYQNASAD